MEEAVAVACEASAAGKDWFGVSTFESCTLPFEFIPIDVEESPGILPDDFVDRWGRCGLVGRLESLLLLLLLILPPRQVQANLGRNVGSLTFWRVLRGFGEESAGGCLWYAWRGFCVG